MACVPTRKKPNNPNPPRQFTEAERERIWGMAAAGLPHADIARVFSCDPDTLKKHCGDILDNAANEAVARVASTLFAKATRGEGKDSVIAAIFWLKNRRRDLWSEQAPQGAQGNVTVVLKRFDDDAADKPE